MAFAVAGCGALTRTRPPSPSQANTRHPRHTRHTHVAMRTSPSHTRRAFVRNAASAYLSAALASAAASLPTAASAAKQQRQAQTADDAPAQIADALATLKAARTAIDACDPCIDAAKWDTVRTILATYPVVTTKASVKNLARVLPDDIRGAVLGMNQDLLSALKFLDTAVYSNVFVGEEREILGTKIDFDTPRAYLADAKAVLDELIDLVESIAS